MIVIEISKYSRSSVQVLTLTFEIKEHFTDALKPVFGDLDGCKWKQSGRYHLTLTPGTTVKWCGSM